MKHRFWLASCVFSFAVHTANAAGIEHVDAWADMSGTVHVRWVTAAASKGHVEYGLGTTLDGRVEEDPSCLRGTTNNRDSGTGWANNHRAEFVAPGWPVSVRVQAVTREGETIASGLLQVEQAVVPRGTVALARLPLSIDAGDWGEARIPVTVGVPFPQGELAGEQHVRVLHGDEELPSQAQVVTRWRADLSVKWLRLSVVVPAGADSVQIEYGHSVQRRPWPALADSVPGLDGRVVMQGADGTQYLARSDGDAVFEESGAVKNVRRWYGRFVASSGASLWRFEARCHTWSGIEAQRWEFTVENDRTDVEMTSIRSLVVSPWSETATRVTVGEGDAQVTLAPGARVLQTEDFAWVVEPDGTKGQRTEGVVRTPDGRLVVLRDFWQQWPASVELAADGRLGLGLCPALPDGLYAGRPDEDKFYYHIRDGLHTFRQGFSKTWEFWTGTAQPRSLSGERPVGSVPPAWIERTFALRGLAVASRDQFADYDEILRENAEAYLTGRDRRREYGMMNFGDWHGERRWNWGNVEYDLGHGFLTQFARTGEATFWRRSEEIIRHQRDVDTRHHARDPRHIGQQWIHSIGHTAGYYDDTYKDMKVYAGRGWSDNRGHIWAQGMFEQYLFGGDRRSWQTALLISDWAAGPQTTNFIFGNAREPGWMSILVMSAYLATEDTFYLNAARIMLQATHEKSLASGDRGFYYHRLPRGHCNCPDDERHAGEAGFMLGVLMRGMKMYYEVTGDPTVANDIVKTGRFIWDSMWVPVDMGFRYTSCPHTAASGGRAWILLEGLAFGARQAQDLELAALCRTALVAAWNQLPRDGKSAGSVLSASAQALHEVAQLPGTTFAEERERIHMLLSSPARRPLPTLLANPDFEESIDGWPSRGWRVEQCTEVKHRGHASLKISGKVSGQNEYVNTAYDTSASPYEIQGLEPGGVYVLSAWLRVDSITPGAPAPSLRLATRDGGGTRGGIPTTAYDLQHKGTWQRLSARVQIPEWNRRNYIALNTNTHDAVDVVMYLDDVRIVREAADTPAASTHIRLHPAAAVLTEGGRCVSHKRFRGDQALGGGGGASWNLPDVPAGTYSVWARVDTGATFSLLTVNGHVVSRDFRSDTLDWLRLGEVRLAEGPLVVSVSGLPVEPLLGRLILTTE